MYTTLCSFIEINSALYFSMLIDGLFVRRMWGIDRYNKALAEIKENQSWINNNKFWKKDTINSELRFIVKTNLSKNEDLSRFRGAVMFLVTLVLILVACVGDLFKTLSYIPIDAIASFFLLQGVTICVTSYIFSSLSKYLLLLGTLTVICLMPCMKEMEEVIIASYCSYFISLKYWQRILGGVILILLPHLCQMFHCAIQRWYYPKYLKIRIRIEKRLFRCATYALSTGKVQILPPKYSFLEKKILKKGDIALQHVKKHLLSRIKNSTLPSFIIYIYLQEKLLFKKYCSKNWYTILPLIIIFTLSLVLIIIQAYNNYAN